MKTAITRAIINKLKGQYEGSFAEAYAEVCEELGVENPAEFESAAQDAWLRNATRYLK